MKKIYLILSLLPSLSLAQQEFSELKVKAYSPRIYLQRDTNIGGFIQGIQTQLQNGTDNWFFGSLGTQNWIVSKGDYTGVKFSINENGNVGVGTENPSEKLEVRGNLKVNSHGTHTGLHLGNEQNDAIITDGTDNKHYGGGYFFRVHNDNIPHKYIDAMMLADNGNIGIGSHNPTEKLDVQGNAKIRSWSPRIYLQRDTDQGGFIQGIQTQLLDGKDNWFFGNLHHDQWIVSKGDYTGVKFSINENGNVGIGTENPSEKLEVRGNLKVNSQGTHTGLHLGKEHNDAIITDGTDNKYYGGGYFFRVHNDHLPHKYIDAMMLTDNGNIGIGVLNPKSKLDVDGFVTLAGNAANLDRHFDPDKLKNAISNSGKVAIGWNLSGGKGETDFISNRGLGSTGGFSFYDIDNNGAINHILNLHNNGNAALYGKFEAKEIKVTETPTADFVFEENYKLPTLQEVEKHIKEKKHLPEIASAKEMEKEGVNVGEFQIQLLQKIEELTLYMIEQNKETNKLHTTVLEQQKQIENLTNKLEQISHEK
ncbi:hypothetical protein SAMN05443634_111119 [Chishuiella changwenlii]|uniref:Uncharacterized protein n=1 Tax=Chishuiella changwenlii TaxID=1434701 RepID=A0A1M7BSE5_9FLAO|nr:hypothetical protein [Chishuiella changwenlii]GGF03506.1 hypothetical protein GCM10010984_21120 [Chishuiella changwenlii]SHL57786.1 hypothetical protein SAMN05443634_111119 [Chishuiella changwenlii]